MYVLCLTICLSSFYFVIVVVIVYLFIYFHFIYCCRCILILMSGLIVIQQLHLQSFYPLSWQHYQYQFKFELKFKSFYQITHIDDLWVMCYGLGQTYLITNILVWTQTQNCTVQMHLYGCLAQVVVVFVTLEYVWLNNKLCTTTL